MPYFSIRNIILHHFHVDNNEGKSGIGYEIIIGHDMMVQLLLSDDFNDQVRQWDGATVPTKEPIGMLGQADLTSHETRKVVMHNE